MLPNSETVTMPPMETSEIVTLEGIATSPTNRRRGPLKSRTVDTLLHILSICYADSSHIIQNSDKGDTHEGSLTKDDAPFTCTDIIPSDSSHQEQMNVDKTRVVLGTQEGGLSKESSCKVDTNHLNSIIIQNQDTILSTLRTGDQETIPLTPKSVTDMMISAPDLPFDIDFEEGEISGEFIDLFDNEPILENNKLTPLFEEGEISGKFIDLIDDEPRLENNKLTPLSIGTVDNVSKDMADIVSKTKRNLVDYSEIALHGKSRESTTPESLQSKELMQTRNQDFVFPVDNVGKNMADIASKTKRNLVDYSEIALHGKPRESTNLESLQSKELILTKNQDFVSLVKDNGAQNDKKRRLSYTDEKRINKKAKNAVDPTTSSDDPTTEGENPEGVSQQVIGASPNKDVDNEKKKKRVLTQERKAKKKRKDRIKRAEKNRKLGVKRIKIQTVIKEKKITYCRHYVKGRCQEGEKCKFSHDTIPLTKSKPCCHFARHSCMKGDDCPFDHQLSKYPCNNYLTKGFCSRGSDCMFSHEAQTVEASLNASNESNSEQKLSKSSSKLQIGPKSTPKPSSQTPKGVTFLSQEKLPLETQVNSEVKHHNEITKTPPVESVLKLPPKGITFLSLEKSQKKPHSSSPQVKQCEIISNEITKTPPVVPRGINFLSFGKKPDSNGGFSLKMGNGIGKSPLSNLKGTIVNVDDGVKPNTKIGNNDTNSESQTDGNTSSRKPMTILPFLSSTSQRMLQSTLAFASKFESGVKTSRPGI